MNVLVTGGAGFIGSNVTDRLIAAGHRVSVVDNLSSGKRAHVHANAAFHHMDVADPAMADLLDRIRPEVVIHHAAQIEIGKSVSQPALDAELNILGGISLLESCRKKGVGKIIYASSAAVYGMPRKLPIAETHPVSPLSGYGVSKHTLEHYLEVYRHLYGMSYTVLRYANAYGIRQDPRGEGGVISIFTERLLNGKPCVIQGDGGQTRDFVYVTDIAKANLLALDRCDGEIINIGTGKAVSIRELYNTMAALVPDAMPPETAPERIGDIHDSCFDITRARERLGWEPQVTLSEGLRQTLAYYRTRL